MKIRENFFILDCYFFVVDILIFDVSSLALHLSVSETSLNQESFEPGSVDCLLLVLHLSRKIVPHCVKN